MAEGETATIDTAPEVGIRIDPDATYTNQTLAAALGVSVRCLEKWRRDRRMRFPRPFFMGRTPHWRGRAVVRWMDERQAEAEA
jgi:predicted DNA-binding transcriptional regulator AlpA